MNVHQTSATVEEVSQELLDTFLAPYKEHCRYLKRAEFEYVDSVTSQERSWLINGEFAIPESCYIDDTGHFNSVEFNICYNQLFYIMIAHSVKHKLLAAMNDWDLATFKRRQLSDFLIVRFSSTFKQPMNSDCFQGTLSINRCSVRSNLIMLKTSCAFSDRNGGSGSGSEGEVTIAVLNDQSSRSPESIQGSVSRRS
jgi:hypothetical protein